MFPILFGAILALSVQTTSSASLLPAAESTIVAEKQYSLLDRYADKSVNDVFSENILLTLAYLRGTAKENEPVDWSKITKDFTFAFTLEPGQTFAFHDQVLPEFGRSVALTTNAHFDSAEGFKSDGWLVADGVCHLASFLNVVAKNAGLDVVAPTAHDFAAIPDVPRENGTAIYYTPDNPSTSKLQNLYITNTFSYPVKFVFTYKNNALDITVEK